MPPYISATFASSMISSVLANALAHTAATLIDRVPRIASATSFSFVQLVFSRRTVVIADNAFTNLGCTNNVPRFTPSFVAESRKVLIEGSPVDGEVEAPENLLLLDLLFGMGDRFTFTGDLGDSIILAHAA